MGVEGPPASRAQMLWAAPPPIQAPEDACFSAPAWVQEQGCSIHFWNTQVYQQCQTSIRTKGGTAVGMGKASERCIGAARWAPVRRHRGGAAGPVGAGACAGSLASYIIVFSVTITTSESAATNDRALRASARGLVRPEAFRTGALHFHDSRSILETRLGCTRAELK